MDLEKVKHIGVAAAYKGADILRGRFGKLKDVQKKGAIDLVTEADTASEKAIVDTIRTAFPDHGILGEEGGYQRGRTDRCWIVDPLDGTTNYAHGLSLFCVSIAYTQNSDILFGTVLNPAAGELFTAVDGCGAFCNGASIRVSETASMEDSMLVTGFPYNVRQILPDVVKRFANCLGAAQGIRRLGSAALDLCYVAAGRFEAFWEQNLHPWDTAAGWLIAREAGACSTDFSNRPFHLESKEMLTTNGKIHQQMLELLDIKDSP